MRITPIGAAPRYVPALHYGVASARLQGMEAGDTDHFWVGLSRYQPDSHTDDAPTPQETVYVVLAGELTIAVDGHESTIVQHDSVHLPQGTRRVLRNTSGCEALLLVIMALPTARTPESIR
jgi:mannose-6-phosphate isomerase-like protein (cupin superfamily)